MAGHRVHRVQRERARSGTGRRLGAVGVAQWRGVRRSTVLRLAGLTREAVDIMPRGLDAEYVDTGENLGRARRPPPRRQGDEGRPARLRDERRAPAARPAAVPDNPLGDLFGAVVRHPITVS